jgi:hypothetical protein
MRVMRLNAHTGRRAGVVYCTVWVRHSQRANAVRIELGSQTGAKLFGHQILSIFEFGPEFGHWIKS